MKYCEMTKAELSSELALLQKQYSDVKAKGLSLDISRGKPCREQLDLSDGMLQYVQSAEDCKTENGFDCRNYGLFDGVPEAKRLFSELFIEIPKSTPEIMLPTTPLLI